MRLCRRAGCTDKQRRRLRALWLDWDLDENGDATFLTATELADRESVSKTAIYYTIEQVIPKAPEFGEWWRGRHPTKEQHP